jgi:hypothetical protein
MRALVRYANQAFAQMVLTAGSKNSMDFDSFGAARKRALASAKLLLLAGRGGRELPRTFDPLSSDSSSKTTRRDESYWHRRILGLCGSKQDNTLNLF